MAVSITKNGDLVFDDSVAKGARKGTARGGDGVIRKFLRSHNLDRCDQAILNHKYYTKNPAYLEIDVVGGPNRRLIYEVDKWFFWHNDIHRALVLLSDGSWVTDRRNYRGKFIPGFAKCLAEGDLKKFTKLFVTEDYVRVAEGLVSALGTQPISMWQNNVIFTKYHESQIGENPITQPIVMVIMERFMAGVSEYMQKVCNEYKAGYTDCALISLAKGENPVDTPLSNYWGDGAKPPSGFYTYYMPVLGAAVQEYLEINLNCMAVADIPEPPNHPVYKVTLIEILRSYLIKSKLKGG